MKTISQKTFVVATGLLLAFNIPAFAIEGLRVSVQCSNVVLSWPSVMGETYIVQYRQTLAPTDTWQTLISSLPADMGTNVTAFVHTNVVQYPNCGVGTFSAMAANRNMAISVPSIPLVPLAIPRDGSSAAVPACLYPPGFDFSGFVIVDPATGESVNGSEYSKARALAPSDPLFGGPEPLDSGGSGSSVETGFYWVVRNGAHLYGITNGMTLFGLVTIPVELANDSGTLANLSLTENDSPVNGSSIKTAPFQGAVQLTVDTTQMSNGVHQISAGARWDDTNGGLWEADSPPVTVNVYNEISFPNWMPHFGQLYNYLLIRATSAHTSADWYVDVYDSQYAYIGTFEGHTDDGDIYIVWNLVGPYGEQHTNDSFFICGVTTEFSNSSNPNNVQPAYNSSSYVITPFLLRITGPWFGSGGWAAAAQHAWDNYVDCDQLYSMLGGFVGGAQGVGWQVNPPPIQGDYGVEPFPLHYDPTGQDPQGAYDWAALRDALFTNFYSRNFVYFGHGGPNGLGHNPANASRYISATEIGNKLNTNPNSTSLWHGFRFVFLDGCSTAKGKLPGAFGIQNKENIPVDDYLNAGMRPCAFVGWDEDKIIGTLDTGGGFINYDHVAFIQHIPEFMLLGQPIKQAIKTAAGQFDVHGRYGPNGEDLKVFGCWTLGFGDYNE